MTRINVLCLLVRECWICDLAGLLEGITTTRPHHILSVLILTLNPLSTIMVVFNSFDKKLLTDQITVIGSEMSA